MKGLSENAKTDAEKECIIELTNIYTIKKSFVERNDVEMITKRGRRLWFIPDGYYPAQSSGEFKSHEAICVLNTGKKDAHIDITLYFEDREKLEGYKTICKAERTNHIRMDKIENVAGQGVPMGTPYAMVVSSDTEIIVQYSRMDTSQAEMTLMTTIAFPFK